uniref:OSJNBb0076A22.4 protein n=1 Tax=Oryza sativa subsp. japonica TaxID=39947 RepID=Q7XV81_ORYSJ|nr:OSJNBb0076A22.4 [Oryza sativa Japonica Group]
MAPSFEVDCNNTANGFKPFVGNVEVISLSNGQARVMNHVSSSCYNRTSRQMNPADVWYLNLTGTPYRLSDSANKFTVIGCRTLAYTFDDYNVGKYMSGCVSVCRRGDLSSAINGSCVGIGCCQTNISTGLSYYEVMFDYTLNTSGIYNRTPCSYAVLMESSSFTFSTTYLTSRAFNTSYGGQAPLVLDWAIRTANNCVEAQKNPASYACKGDYSVCLNSTNGPGYICNCKKGYQGNPYLQDSNGCQGSFLHCQIMSLSARSREKQVKLRRMSLCVPEGRAQHSWLRAKGTKPRRLSSALGVVDQRSWSSSSRKDIMSFAKPTDLPVLIFPVGKEPYNKFKGFYRAEYFKNNIQLGGLHGRKDINECQDSNNYPCHGECHNKPGDFDCFCRAGSRGNATIPGGCRKDFLPLKAQLAIGIAACVLAGLFAFLGWEVIRHKRSIRKQALLRQTDEFFQQHGGQLLLEMMKAEGNIGFTLYKRVEIETATKNFNKAQIIGEGGQGTVYKAVLDGTVVAIKKCKEIDESRKMDFMQELVILCRVNHPNIVKLLGCCLQFEAPMLVYEFVENKTLQELLDLQRSKRFHVTLGTRLRIAAESADALGHLHSLPHPILHGDVKPANILLAEGLVAKVSDFGCSTIDEKTQSMLKGTPGYIDPEYLLEYQLTAKNDVYSFGVILLELLTSKRPLSKESKTLASMFQEAMMDGTFHELLDSEIIDEASMGVLHQIAVLAIQCLALPGMSRPVMEQVAKELRRLALSDEVQQCPQPPLVLEGLNFAVMGSMCTTSLLYTEGNSTGVYDLEKKTVMSTEFAR